MIVVRAAAAEDAASIANIYAPYVAQSAVSFEVEPPTAAEIARRIDDHDGLYPWLVAHNDDDSTLLGFAYASQFRPRPGYRYTVETGAYVATDIVGLGVGRLLYTTLLATLEAQDFTQAIASITLPNERSIDLHEAVGFQRAGVYRAVGFKHGQWRDVSIWQRELAEASLPPLEPKKFTEVGVVRDS